MTPSEALEQVALEFGQRRAKLASAAACAVIDARRAHSETERRAAAVYACELQAQINELTWAIDRLRQRAELIRGEAAA